MFSTAPGFVARLVVALLGGAAVLLAQPSLAQTTPETGARAYEFGVFPYLPPLELEKVFAPIATEFATILGREVRFRSSSDYGTFSKNLDSEQYDIAFIQPFFYADVASKKGYVPLAARSEALTAIVVTSAAGPIQTLANLKGVTITLPPESAAVSLLTKAYLTTQGLLPDRDVQYAHVKSHNSCLHQLLIGETTACGTAKVTLRYFEQKMATQLRVVAETPGIPHSLFVAHSRIPENVRTALIKRIIDWHNTDSGRAVLAAGQFSTFKPAVDKDYDEVRAMSARQRAAEQTN